MLFKKLPVIFKRALILLCLFLSIIVVYSVSQERKNSIDCLTCHSNNLDLDKEFIHPYIKDNRCNVCHVFYDTNTHTEMTKPEVDICAICHPEEELGRSHPIGEGVIDPNTNSPMTCVSSCHLLHGSDYKYYLPFKNNMELCVSCHTEKGF